MLSIYSIVKEGDFYIVYHLNKEISRKKSLYQATKSLAAFEKGRQP
jgi:hypothetical protein